MPRSLAFMAYALGSARVPVSTTGQMQHHPAPPEVNATAERTAAAGIASPTAHFDGAPRAGAGAGQQPRYEWRRAG